jgi:hypothetical protein
MAKVSKNVINDADQAVLDLLKKVAAKREEIKKAKTRPSWKTNCTFMKDPSTPQSVTNIQTVRDIRKLIEIQAFLMNQETTMNQAASELGVEFDGNWQGFSMDDWKEDLKTRAEQLQIDKNEKELEELDARVNKLVSPEQRREMELKTLMEILK